MCNQRESLSHKRICFLVDSLGIGGRENVLIDAVKCLSHEYDITIAALYGISEELQERVKGQATILSNLLGQSYRVQDLVLLSLPVIGPYLFRRYVPGTYDYLIIMHPAHLMAACTKIGSYKICWTHTDKDAAWAKNDMLSLFQRIKKLRLKLCYSKVNATWVVTDAIRDAMRKAFSLSNIHTLENPIDCKEIARKSTEFEPIEIDSDFYNFVMVGRLSHEKGHIRALRAFEKLKSDVPCKLIIVGDGPERSELEAYVRSSHMENHVVFTGFKNNPYPYIRCANTLIQPSFVESFGLTMLEAMMLSTAVITTDTIGGVRVTDHGRYGILVDNTEEGIYRGMQQALRMETCTDEQRHIAYDWVQNFDLPYFCKQLKYLINQ